MSYLHELNNVQQQAVTTIEGPVLVVAGPGSGKTRVLTYRIAYLIEQGISPWNILSLTFTNKAAREMKERIAKVVGNVANDVWAGTFHSIFARILRIEAEKIGYPKNFTIYDSDDAKSAITAIIKEMNLSKDAYHAGSVLGRISSAKSNIITPKMYAENETLLEQDRIAKCPYIYKIYEMYVNRCRRSGAMDFDDLLLYFFVLLHKNPENVADKYRQKFRYILVDEFQDTNYLQYQILKKLVDYEGSPHNICVVGDDAQSIYAFRGATIDNILDFEKEYKNLQVFKLEQNYRSTEHIVQAANEVIAHNKRQIQKKIWSDKGNGAKINVIKTMTDNEEGKRIADLILEQKTRHHFRNSDIAILYRTNAQSRIFEESLRRYNIPFKVFGGLSFYSRKEIKDIIAYLRLAINPHDEEALRRVINYPRRGIGDSTIEKISAMATTQNQSMWAVLPNIDLGASARRSVNDFITMVNAFGIKASEGNAYDAAHFILKQSRIMEDLKADTTLEGIGRIENVNALLDGIKDFVENDEFTESVGFADKTLVSYLQNIALVSDVTNENEGENSNEYVTLMSIHSAKGLEFKSVFVVGLEESLFPSFMAMDTQEGMDEERRLFYVAITRAEQNLTLSYATSRYKFGQIRYNDASRFLEEISGLHVEGSSTLKNQTPVKVNFSLGNPTAKIGGAFKPLLKKTNAPTVDLSNFKPSPVEHLTKGMKVLHQKFGEGVIINIDGSRDNRVATVNFPEIEDPQERRIMLKFAKLQILQ
ncbi:MAG: UvrD-helicase domain-containing protein [Saprospiraceae bacterium]|nr:UvrD-helicase domain-containing protein [Saprospiraceae bacterium]MBP7679790.1 UvrD-helicase domain-containing protein [Saprospiraceae bacterium]